MRLYHGSNVEIHDINLEKSRPFKDFGRGFYLSDNEAQAYEMAKQKVLQQERGKETITVFEFDERNLSDKQFNVKVFDDYTEEWAEFILANRDKASKENKVHEYDIVVGPIADDRVGLQIRLFLDDYIDLPILVKRLRYIKGKTIQYYFGTERAIQLLKKL